MVNISPELYVNGTLEIGSIYKLKAPELITTDIPHYFIVVATDHPEIYMVLCTSQKINKEKHFEWNDLDLTGLVYIKPDSSNCLTLDSYINCNDYHTITKKKLINKKATGELEYIGKINLNYYTQIKKGIIESHTNDLPEYLLKYS